VDFNFYWKKNSCCFVLLILLGWKIITANKSEKRNSGERGRSGYREIVIKWFGRDVVVSYAQWKKIAEVEKNVGGKRRKKI
jgi:hypothetical protein